MIAAQILVSSVLPKGNFSDVGHPALHPSSIGQVLLFSRNHDLGIHPPGAGILGYLEGLPFLTVALIPVLLLSRVRGTVPAHPIVKESRGNPVTLAFILSLACIRAPVVEDTFFRGMLFGCLHRRLHRASSGILTGFLSAVTHPQRWIAVPLLATIGFTLSAIRQWRATRSSHR